MQRLATLPPSALGLPKFDLARVVGIPLLSLAKWYCQRAQFGSVSEPAMASAESAESLRSQQSVHEAPRGIRGLVNVAADRLLQTSSHREFGGARTATTNAHQAAAEEFAATYPKCKVKINEHELEVPEGTSVLEAARSIGVHIPTLCTHPRLVAMGTKPPGTCRLCLVDVKGKLVPACATPVSEGMQVATDTEEVQDNVRGVLSLLRANHPDDCMLCESNGRCEFQDLIMRYHIDNGLPKLRDYSHEWDEELEDEVVARHDSSTASLLFDLDKCIKCGRCVTACNAIQDMGVLGMLDRGRHRHPGKLIDTPLDLTKCIECGQCSSVCPTNAIHERPQWEEVLGLLEARRKVMVVQTAPAVRVAIGEELGLAPGAISTGQMAEALRRLGFNYVFDTNFSADLTIMEEGTELLKRLQAKWDAQEAAASKEGGGKGEEGEVHEGEGTAQEGGAQGGNKEEEHLGPLPMFTSCCPAWINAVEKGYPELIPHLSTCRSPQMMLGSVIKKVWAPRVGVSPSDVVSVSIMPCTAKKHEAAMDKFVSPGGHRDVDYVLTTRELGQMLRHAKVPLASLPEAGFDNPLGDSSGAAVLFGVTGGVMEAAVRTVYSIVTGHDLPGGLELDEVRGLKGVKEATLSLKHPSGSGVDKSVRVAVASGIGNARHLLERMRSGEAEYDLVEVMACPGGCIGGGGQPKSQDPTVLLKRMGGIYAIDRDMPVRQSHLNPSIQKLYSEELGGSPGTHVAHDILHTHYDDLSRSTVPPYSVAEGPQHTGESVLVRGGEEGEKEQSKKKQGHEA